MIHALLLAGLCAFSAPAIYSEGVRRITPTKSHAQHPDPFQNLKAHYVSRSSGILLIWNGGRGRLEQTIKFPAYDLEKVGDDTGGWWLSDYKDAPHRPRAFRCFDASLPLLVFVAKRESGVYGIQSPIIYALHHNRWELLTVKPSLTEFTDRGSFYLSGNKLYVWDYAADDRYAHQAPQRYWLKTFLIKRDRLVKMHTLTTSHRYSIIEEYPLPANYPAEKDPLREFGLRWRWWGRGQTALKLQ
ncbi:MAG: hypothetical protein ABIY70_21045 [Capsulimonas sp.]|uniref:hypothetical protein n=1 Tax=Capsulimonas sp. TaxID=2494211 RepID=UPI00326457D5